MKTIHAILISALVSLASSASAASPFVDPDGIGAEASAMLVPEKIVSSCQPGEFWISLNDPIVDTGAASTPLAVEHPLTATGSKHVISCKHGGHTVDATLLVSPPGESGMCSATYFIKATVKLNDRFVLGSAFANYCTEWGMTAIRLDNNGSEDGFRFLTVCGYWGVAAEILERGGSVKTFRCEKLPLEKMIDGGLLFTDGEVRKL